MVSPGKLVVFYGCMFAGKTTALIDYISKSGLKTSDMLIFKPGIDNRAANNIMATHDGKKHECLSLDKDTVLYELITPYTRLIVLDEAQFFDKLVFSELKRCLARGIDIVASGLDKDYLARPFGLMPLLMQNATELIELAANCDACGDKATYTYRKESNKVLVLIGDKNYYEARCEKCYRSGMSLSQ